MTTSTAEPLNVVLCWHMHQPCYRQGPEGTYGLPWVYLHGIKDYSDMVAHLERHPMMRVVVNFAPVLLEQLDDYARQLDRLLQHGQRTGERLLNLLSGVEPIPADVAGRQRLILECQRCHAPRMIHPYPAFQHLLGMCGAAEVGSTKMQGHLRYFSEQYFLDLLTWYHLSWLGHSLRAGPLVQRLMTQAGDFSTTDRHALLQLIQCCLAGLIPRYRALAERGQIELSMTPYGHPIVPLLNDFANLHDAQQNVPVPKAAAYPGGAARVHWHLQNGIEVFKRFFGYKPVGVWLSEGGVSEDALQQLDEMGFQWTASGEEVWRNSCIKSGIAPADLYSKVPLFSPSSIDGFKIRVFFRDDGLSDLIGFKYSNWHADDAVADLVHHLENISGFFAGNPGQHVVSIILDGENAWEYYPDNGHHFLDALYAVLTRHHALKPTTFADLSASIPAWPMPRLAAGSWVYGSFSTWIGSDDKNRGWDYLVAAKRAYDETIKAGSLDDARLAKATRQLAVCEGSDWFWWFGDYNPSGSVSDFEQLYRVQLRELYRLLDVSAPVELDVPLSSGGGWAENAGTMRRNA